MIGSLIRKERIKQGLSLESLSLDICSPSYLSKIESSSVSAHPEINQLLLDKLKISVIYEVSENKIAEAKKVLEVFFMEDDFSKISQFYLENKDLKYSAISTFYMLIESIYKLGINKLSHQDTKTLINLKPSNSSEQYYQSMVLGLIYLFNGQLDTAETFFEKASELNYFGLGNYEKAQCKFSRGSYQTAFYLFNKQYQFEISFGNMTFAKRISKEILDTICIMGEVNCLDDFLLERERLIENKLSKRERKYYQLISGFQNNDFKRISEMKTSSLINHPYIYLIYSYSSNKYNNSRDTEKILEKYKNWLSSNELPWEYEESLHAFYKENILQIIQILTVENNKLDLDLLKTAMDTAFSLRLTILAEILKTILIEELVENRKYKEAYNLTNKK
ncbi:helix-turn-helix domain-containing protein [Floricoccus penangensis]|uniref:helix-turn-helix domain-containing protein n=1 Tax=Floricoccus penangensis TaxID=1859475 RepID=UPI0020412463|nr:helix-turn-helix transcriptional regulator [Floricoccus penangensis]URZ86957.1 helix-turn-helix domain-containing protein [Floricoccus penangensis]